jgi:putative Mn2+ efflux pump MntP
MAGKEHWMVRLVVAGCACVIVVVLTHVAERLQLLPSTGWGLPDSPGHYVDLISAILGVVLLLIAGVLWLARQIQSRQKKGRCTRHRPSSTTT